ncbi:MAG: hypothetical protein V7637_1882 [Mycobacteriales bacterium]|jgi:transcriptional regulator with XRE-family HTH domain
MMHRRRLRKELKRERESASLTQREVAVAMDWSLSKLIRIEAGLVSIATNDLRVLLSHYGIDDAARTEALIETARIARTRSPWQDYSDLVSPELLMFLVFEAGATVIRYFEPLFVPGLLQTEDYARAALAAAFDVELTSNEKDRLVQLRTERQEILTQERASLHFIVDEAVIRRVAGDVDIMRGQLRRLLELLDRPNVDIRVVPYTFGLYRTFQTPHVHFEFEDPTDEDVLYIENPRGDLLVREASGDSGGPTPANYLASFLQLQEGLDAEATRELISAAMGALPPR